MSRANDFRARLLGITFNPPCPMRICEEEELIGCTEEELAHIEEAAGFPLPRSYKEFMRVAGRDSGVFMAEMHIHYPYVLDTNKSTKARCSRYMVLPEPCFIFLNRYGVFAFFTNEGDDPPIYISSADGYRKACDSLRDLIEDELRGIEFSLKRT